MGEQSHKDRITALVDLGWSHDQFCQQMQRDDPGDALYMRSPTNRYCIIQETGWSLPIADNDPRMLAINNILRAAQVIWDTRHARYGGAFESAYGTQAYEHTIAETFCVIRAFKNQNPDDDHLVRIGSHRVD